MIKKESFGYVINCDKCSNYLTCDDYDDFQLAIQKAKYNDWKIRKIDDEWIHLCPVCAEKE